MIDFSQKVLFGGSFDPIHLGHIALAQSIKSQTKYKNVIFIPAYQSPGKKNPLAPASLRLKWVKDAVIPLGFEVWDYEIKRAQESFSIYTVQEVYSHTQVDVPVLVGADSYASLESWKNYTELRAKACFLVVNRPGYELQKKSPKDQILEIPENFLSSTSIRLDLKKGLIPEKALPEPVERDIHNLILLSQNPYVKDN
ncbi:MAG: nicotinate (nicotinamide) nucleotide adenylyltransferase [Oligoflexia bacterium]|nr:nicotinate (nicotinamide) nucleotide adenylyltransferase [Oligoflexia bacterium]